MHEKQAQRREKTVLPINLDIFLINLIFFFSIINFDGFVIWLLDLKINK